MLQIILWTISVLLLCIYLYYKHLLSYWKRLGVVYLEPSIPLGNFIFDINDKLMQTISDIYLKLRKTAEKYGGFYLLGIPVFMPLDPELYKTILIKDFQHFCDRGFYCDEKIDPMSSSILTQQGAKWKFLRSKFGPTFSAAKMKMIFPIIQQCANGIEKVIEKNSKQMQSESSVDIRDITLRYTMDVICSTVFGFQCNTLENPNEEILRYGKMFQQSTLLDSIKLALGVIAPSILQFCKVSFFNAKLTSFFYNVIKSNVEYRETNHIVRNDLMDQLIRLKNGESIDDEDENDVIGTKLSFVQIASQAFVFFVGGYETSSSTISYCLLELAQYQDIQNKVRKEIQDTLKKYNGELTYEALSEMTYTEMVLNETMRKFPPISMLNRICTKGYQIPNSNLTLKKNTVVVIPTLGIHNDPEYYPEPDKFIPERFTEEEISKRHPFTFMPFGNGPRICLGLKLAVIQIKLGLVAFLKDYKYTIHKDMKLPFETHSTGNLLTSKTKILLKPTKL